MNGGATADAPAVRQRAQLQPAPAAHPSRARPPPVAAPPASPKAGPPRGPGPMNLESAGPGPRGSPALGERARSDWFQRRLRVAAVLVVVDEAVGAGVMAGRLTRLVQLGQDRVRQLLAQFHTPLIE